MKILLAEDDNEMRAMLTALLRDTGHEVTEATDGRIALQLFRSQPFDLVLTDLVMPNRDGVELIAAIRRLNAAVPIIAISGGYRTDSLQTIASASAAGANEILYKPFAIADLTSLIRKLISDASK